MSLVYPNLVCERTSTIGQGDLVLTGAVSPNFTFASQVANAAQFYYRISEGAKQEGGIGTYNASLNKIVRTTVIFSSAGGTTKISLTTGKAKVWVDVLGAFFTDIASGALLPSNNLSDLTSFPDARTNLGLGTLAVQNSIAVAITGGTIAGTTITLPGTLLSPGSLLPETDDAVAIGSTAKKISDIFFATGAVVNFGAGNVTWTHGNGFMTLAGGYAYLSGAGVSLYTAGAIVTRGSIADDTNSVLTIGGGTSGRTTVSGTMTISGHLTVEGVTSAGATGTTNLVFSVSPALTGTPTAPTAAATTSTTQIATTAFVQQELATAVAGLLDFKGNTDASGNPNYPAASKGDTYYINVAGKVGGASGKSVDIGDAVIANADNAGGTEVSVGTSWFVLEHNLAGALLAANNLSDVASASSARTNLGLGTGNSPTFAAVTASTFTGALVGNSDTATSATNSTNSTNAAITDDTTTNATMYLAWVSATSGNHPIKVSSNKATWNPSTGQITATGFVGALTGNADTASSVPAPNLSGTTIASNVTASSLTSFGSSPALTGTPTAPTAAGGTNTTQIATTAFVTSAVATAVTGTLKFMGATDCSGNPNYPAASKGDVYVVSVAGKIGGASGTSVDVGDEYFATADNAGGTQASVGTSWATLEHNLAGALLAANNLSDVASATSAATSLGVGTGNSPQFTAVNIGHATDTTLARSASGKIAVEGKAVPLMSGAFDAVFAGPTASRTYTFPDADTTFGAASTGANPSASVGLSAVNGSAATFLRSDGAPALDQSIVPTWTGAHTFTPAARSSGVAPYLKINASGDTALTASTEAIGVYFAGNGSARQHSTGALTTQREYVFDQPTYSFVGASTITTAATLAIVDAPAAGTNATITNKYALWVQAGNTRLDGLLGIGVAPSYLVDLSSSSITRGVNVALSTASAIGVRAAITSTSGNNYGSSFLATGASANTNTAVYANASGASTANYGIYIEGPSSGASNYAIRASCSSVSLFDADVQITTVGTGSTSAVTCGGTQTLTNKTLTTPVINGLPTGTGVASAATASVLVSRDANANISANSFLDGYTTTATAAGTTTLTVSSTRQQFFTGSTTQTVALPVASTLTLGQDFEIINNSSGVVTVQSSGGNTIVAMPNNTKVRVVCILTSGTGTASWDVKVEGVAVSGGGTLLWFSGATLSGATSIGTGNAFTCGTVELGAASDTTLSRSSAGVLAVEGVVIPSISSTDTLANKTLTAPKFANAGFIADANGNEQIVFTTTTSAVNYVKVTNSATGNPAKLEAAGDDTNINLRLAGKGTGGVYIGTDTSPLGSNALLQVQGGNNTWTTVFQASTTTGQSYGPNIAAGTNTSDFALYITNAGTGTQYFSIRGDGLVRAHQALQSDKTLTLLGAAAGYPAMNIGIGGPPTSASDGDIWREDNTNTGLKIRINGVTKTITVS